MTEDQYTARIQAIEDWANTEVDGYIFRGCKPTSVAPTTEELLREAAIAAGNRTQHQAQIQEIEATMRYLTECVEADFYGMPRESPQTTQQQAMLEHFEMEHP